MNDYFIRYKSSKYDVVQYQSMREARNKEREKVGPVTYIRKATPGEIRMYQKIRDSKTL